MGLWSDIQAGEAVARSLAVSGPERSTLIAISLLVDVNTLIDGLLSASFNVMREPDIAGTKNQRDGMPCAVDTESGTITLIDWKGTNRSGPVGLDDHFACPTVTD